MLKYFANVFLMKKAKVFIYFLISINKQKACADRIQYASLLERIQKLN